MASNDLVTIGELARSSGVPIKTIRHYSDLGLLPPARVTAARYRLYDRLALADLETIRLFRSLEFPLDAIASIVGRSRPVRESLQLQLDAVESALRRLRRTRAVLARALEVGSDDELRAVVGRLQSIAALDAAERGAIMRAAMESHLSGSLIDEAWRAQLWDAAFKGLPDELSDAQWRALFELMDLVHDKSFGAHLAAMGKRHWRHGRQRPSDRSKRELAGLIADGARAHDDQEDVASRRASQLVTRYVRWSARQTGKSPTAAHAHWLLREAAKHDPREERFWELVGIVRGWPPGPSVQTRAFRWLFKAMAAQYAST
ncbi:MAG TPA: MerR family transcriptional regulator [Vicinamibacterales bacterium]|nr:MerR family transcriptional regulator [Vicinamibacterales bacterium]